MMNIFAAEPSILESSSELISFLSSPYRDTVLQGLKLLVNQARPLAVDRPLDHKTDSILDSYCNAFPRLDHFFSLLDSVFEDGNLEYYVQLFDAIRMMVFFKKRKGATALQACCAKILSHLKLLFRCIHAGNNQLLAVSIALLTAIARTGRSGADSVREAFDFSMRPLGQILMQAKKLPSGDADRSMWSLRQVYVDFILSLLENGSFETKEFVSKLKTVFTGVFKLLPKDHPILQRRILLTMKRCVLEDTGYKLAVSIFTAANTYSIVLLNEADGWSAFLHDLLTIPGEGVCFAVVKPDENKYFELKNKIVLDLLPLLKPLESERQQDLAVSLLAACPDTVCRYLERMKFNFEADGSDRWTALIAFTCRILSIPLNGAMLSIQAACDLCLLPFMPSRSIISKCLAPSDSPALRICMVTLLMDLSMRLHSMLSFIEANAASSIDAWSKRDSLIASFLKACPDLQSLLSALDCICSQGDGSEVSMIVQTRFYAFMAVYALFVDTEKVSIQRHLQLARSSANKELSSSIIAFVSSLTHRYALSLADVGGINTSIKKLLHSYILRNVMSSDLDAAERIANWADVNRAEFFERLSSGGKDFGQIGTVGSITDASTRQCIPEKTAVSRNRKRKLGNGPEEMTSRGLFLWLGREFIGRTLKSGDLAGDGKGCEYLNELEGDCKVGLKPLLQLIAGGLSDEKQVIDSAFCTLQLPVILLSMASLDQGTRHIAYCLIDMIYSNLVQDSDRVAAFKERRQIKMLLDALKNSTEEYAMQQPLARSIFCAFAVQILCQPSNPLYSLINNLLLKRPVLPSAPGIPFFDALVESTECPVQCLKLSNRLRDCIVSREPSAMPDWQIARLQIMNMLM